MNIRILMLGDTAFTIEFPDLMGATGAQSVRSLRRRIQTKIDGGELEGIIDIISASRSLTICMDPLIADFRHIQDTIQTIASEPFQAQENKGTLWTLPACYEGDYAPDLCDIAGRASLTPDEVTQIHSGQIYDVLLIGFLPGFPFMSEIPESLRFPRRTSPRLRVPAGTVAIANNQTAIYPWESPGGWHLLARCPVPLFNPAWERPSLLSPGDQVRFEPISEIQFEKLQVDLTEGRLLSSSFADHKEAVT